MTNMKEAAIEAAKLTDVKAAVLADLIADINRECSSLCAKNSTSLFKLSKATNLANFSAVSQEQELCQDTPIFLTLLKAAAVNQDQLQKNKLKTEEVLVHGITTAAGILLYCRSQQMNTIQMMTALQLQHGGASQTAMERLHKRFLCVSPNLVTSLQDQFAINFDQEVRVWEAELLKERSVEAEYVSVIGTADHDEAVKRLEAFNKLRHPGYALVGDNVDLRVRMLQIIYFLYLCSKSYLLYTGL